MYKFAFFGSSKLSVIVLDELKSAGLLPACIVTTSDKPVGRKQEMTPNIVKTWGNTRRIPVYDSAPKDLATDLEKAKCAVFIVASYGRIISANILDIPPRKTLNIHPSLLPIYRGPSPLPTAMLDDAKETGVTIMRLDAEMDHGPIIAQKPVTVAEWPMYEEFEEMMAKEGAALLISILPDWVAGKIKEKEQDHSKASYTKKITKEDALLDLKADPYLNFRKIQAFHEWPQAYFMHAHNGRDIRVKVTRAKFMDGILYMQKVIPEGGREMSFKDFVSGYGLPTGLSFVEY